MGLTEDRDTVSRGSELRNYPVAAGEHIYGGALVVLNATGYLEAATTALAKVAAGRAEFEVDNTNGQDGDQTCDVREGEFKYDNSAAADEITIAEIGDVCYIVDDETVAKTNGGGTRSQAGFVTGVDDDGVWVKTPIQVGATAGLTAANNLSDVNSAATSRANIGANKLVLPLRVTDLAGANAVLYGIVSPVAGTIKTIRSVLKGHALATGDATLTGKIGGVAITDGAITITQAGSAIGDKDLATPSAANVVAAGDEIQVQVGGTNDNAAAFAEVSIEIEY